MISRQDSTASFDSSNRGHSQMGDNNMAANSMLGRNSTRKSNSNNLSNRTSSLGRNQSMNQRKKISMNDMNENIDDYEESYDDHKSQKTNSSANLSNSGHTGHNHKTRLQVPNNIGDSREMTPSPRASRNQSGKNPFGNDYTMREIGGGSYDKDDDPRNMSHEQLMDMVQRQRDEMDYKDAQIKHLEEYVDTLLVKIISCNPEILNSEFAPTSSDAHKKLEEKHSLDMQRNRSAVDANGFPGSPGGKGGVMKKKFKG